MRTFTTTDAIPSMSRTVRSARSSTFARLVGVAIAALVPAVFWSAIIGLGALWIGKPLSSNTIEIIGGSIAIFLFVVCAPLMLRKLPAERDEIGTRAP
jgi:hypothetical protein